MTTLPQILASQSQKEVIANENFTATSPAAAFGKRPAGSSGLVWGYFGGMVRIGGELTAVADGTVTLAANATNYVELTDAGTVTTNTTAFTAGAIPLYTVVTGASGVSSEADKRTLYAIA